MMSVHYFSKNKSQIFVLHLVYFLVCLQKKSPHCLTYMYYHLFLSAHLCIIRHGILKYHIPNFKGPLSYYIVIIYLCMHAKLMSHSMTLSL